MKTLVCLLTIVLLFSCHGKISNRGAVGATSTNQIKQTDLCAEQTSPSPQCPSSEDNDDDDGDIEGEDERCSKDCDDICDSWGEAKNFSSYKGDVSTCSDNSYTLTRTGTHSRTCPDITCDGTKKECPTTETVTETKKKECRCSTIANGEECSMVSVCMERACEDGGQRCRHGLGVCIRRGEKEVCTKIDGNESEETCYDW